MHYFFPFGKQNYIVNKKLNFEVVLLKVIYFSKMNCSVYFPIMEQQLELIFDSYQEGIERDFSTIFVHKHLNQKCTQCVFSAIAECGCRMAMSIFFGVMDFFGS